MKPKRPALRYFGGKWRLAPWIISHFPPHTCYVEPFCGAASVLLQKPPAEFEIVNDIDGDLVNFFKVLRERTQDLVAAIQLTPYSRQEYIAAWEPTDDLLERARRYYIRARQGWGGHKPSRKPGWRHQHTDARGKSVVADWNTTDHLHAVATRLKKVQIENDDAIEIIHRYDKPETLFYLDPPYPPDTRTERWKTSAYNHGLTTDYHRQLLDLLQHIQGMAIISSYPNQLYQETLTNWRSESKRSRTTSTARQATEVIWISPPANGQQYLFNPSPSAHPLTIR